MSDPELQVLAHRDDVGAWGVYADALELAADARAPLMSLMLMREARPTPALVEAQAQFFSANKKWLTPPWVLAQGRGCHCVWRRGFVSELHVGARENDPADAAATLATLLAHPSLRFLDALKVSWLTQEDVDVLATRVLPCRTLMLSARRDAPLNLAPLSAALPRLEWLELNRFSVIMDH